MNIDVNNLPEEVTTKIYLMMDDSGWLTSNISELSKYYTTIGSAEVTFKIKQKAEITDEIVDRLRDESQKIRADAQVECERIEQKIQTLLALPKLEAVGK